MLELGLKLRIRTSFVRLIRIESSNAFHSWQGIDERIQPQNKEGKGENWKLHHKRKGDGSEKRIYETNDWNLKSAHVKYHTASGKGVDKIRWSQISKMSDKMIGFSSSTKASFVEGKWEQLDTSKSKKQIGARRSRKHFGPNRPEADHSVCGEEFTSPNPAASSAVEQLCWMLLTYDTSILAPPREGGGNLCSPKPTGFSWRSVKHGRGNWTWLGMNQWLHFHYSVGRRLLEVDLVQAGTERGLVEVVSLVQGVDWAYWTGEVDAY